MLEVRNVNFSYRPNQVIYDLSFSIERGEFFCVLGPNGCGKTTLLKIILGLLSPSSGSVLIDGENVHDLPLNRLAKIMGYIPQAHTPPFPFKVIDVVLMGRTPYLNSLALPSEEDEKIALESLAELNISYLKDKIYTKISGGERQLVLIARAMAQEPDILIMDEPTTSLDFGKQHLFLEQMRYLAQKGISILMVTHDPDQAFFCADKVVLMKNGRLIDIGTPEKMIVEKSMKEMYEINVKINGLILPDNRTIRVCIPVPKRYKSDLGASNGKSPN
jgi:ABC-type cobalamin/Fe3+-siderophores transport system ATPase subunit